MKPEQLIEHPEGGRFREVYRSSRTVGGPDGTARCALTHIYFSLKRGECSRFHRVDADEIWNLYQGVGLSIYTWDGSDTPPVRTVVAASRNRFCHVIPAGIWQAAEPLGGEVLVGCSVAPGFEFTGFQLIDPEGEDARRLLGLAPHLARLVRP
jgi:predicted cupin superfamily sugar epimerase